jgi:hypothetical protein
MAIPLLFPLAAPTFATPIAPGQTLAIEKTTTLVDPFRNASQVNIRAHADLLAAGAVLRSASYQLADGRYVFAYQVGQIFGGAEESPPLDAYYYNPPISANATFYLPFASGYTADVFAAAPPGTAANPPSPTATRTDHTLALSGFGNVAFSSAGLWSQTFFLVTDDDFITREVDFSPNGDLDDRIGASLVAPGPVPEPLSLALLPLAVSALALRFRRNL